MTNRRPGERRLLLGIFFWMLSTGIAMTIGYAAKFDPIISILVVAMLGTSFLGCVAFVGCREQQLLADADRR